MTAERPGGELAHPPSHTTTASPANAETPAVTLCLGIYVIRPKDGQAECWCCGVTGPEGENCQQTVIPA